MQLLLPLSLQPGHVDVGGALALAGLAGEAEIHRPGDLGSAPGVGGGRVGKCLPQHVGPGPSGVGLVAGGHVAGAHRAAGRRRLAALADAGAFFGRPQHPAGVSKPKDCLVLGLGLPRHDPQLGVHRWRVDDLAGVEEAGGVKDLLDLLEELIAGVADHHPDELPPQPAVAMLARKAAPVFLDEGRHVGGYPPKHRQPLGAAEVEQRPQVQLARPGMGIVDTVDAVFFGQQPVKLVDVCR